MEHYMELARTADSESGRELYAGRSTQVTRYLSVSKFRTHELRIDEPEEFGGGDTAANPAEVLLAALAASMEVTCKAWAEYLSIPCGQISTEISGELDLRGFMNTDRRARSGFKNIKAALRVTGPVTAKNLSELRRVLTRCCPILDTVQHGSGVDVQIWRDESS